MKNLEIAKIFFEIADLLELQEDSYKPRAYRRAARSIEQLDEAIVDVAARGELEEIRGVGKAIAKKILEILDTGESEFFNRLQSEVDPGLVELLKIPDVGPKTVRLLHQELNITTIDQLRTALKEHKVRDLRGFGPASEEKLFQNLKLMEGFAGRLFIGDVLPIAEKFVKDLRQLHKVEQIEIAGSLRRWRETIGDIDILVSSTEPQHVMQAFIDHPSVTRVLAQGPTKSSVLVKEDIQVDLRVIKPESFGAALQYFTGSKAHNIALRSLARQRGWKLSEYSLMDTRTEDVIAGAKEEAIYKALDMEWIPPELREDMGEIEAATKHKLPPLVKQSAIRGDLHIHTNWTDGKSSIEEMAQGAIKLGYEYLAICDHSKRVAIARGLDAARLRKQIKAIRKADESLSDLHLLAGIEVDVLPDGSLDLPNDVLAETDIVLAAIHLPSKIKTSVTDLLISACENEMVDVLAHPTGRIVGQRPAFEMDFEAILTVAKTHGVMLEINASHRLDLPAELIRRAKDQGLYFTINSDAHQVAHLELMRYGVGIARRGWLQAKNIANTKPFKELRKTLKHPH